MNRSRFTFIILLCVVLFSCKKQAPQLPSNKIVVDNSEAQTMLAINQNLAAKEDSLLQIFVDKKKQSFIKNELGFWYKIDKAGKGEIITDKSVCSYSYKLLLINEKSVKQGTVKTVIGKKEIVNGLEEGIKLLHYGDCATFIIPWYLAYGMNGDKPLIPPYTSVIYEIKLDNESLE